MPNRTLTMRLKASPTIYWALAACLLGLLHRAIQLWLVATAVTRQATLNPAWQSMQYLPAELLERNFSAAILYLQQTPPLPHFVVGTLYRLSSDPALNAIILIAFAGTLSCIAGALMVLLLARMRIAAPLAFVAALLFVGNSGVILLEYTAFGQCFYEQLAMVGCMIAALAATALAQRNSWSAALWLGFAVALLALSRATFSYLVFPVIAWLLWQRVRPRYLAAFLMPVMLLHGGWAVKQYWVQGQWLWATSTWGGANAQAGESKRHGSLHTSTKVDCAERWPNQVVTQNIFFSFHRLYPDANLAGNLNLLGADLGPSPAARAADLAAQAARGRWVPTDSASFRELSACVQRMYVRQWLRHPRDALMDWAQSYALFWQPLDAYTAVMPITLVASRPVVEGEPRVQAALRRFFDEPTYFARQEKMPWFIGQTLPSLVPANVVVIPFAPQLATFLAFAMLHSLPLVAAYIRVKKGSLRSAFPAGFSFLLLLYIYVAGISNMVEHGENMRFRLPVEPIVWSIGIAAAAALAAQRPRRKSGNTI